MNLKTLLSVHALLTFAAGIVLIVAPSVVPDTVNIQINKDQYLLCYFLGAAEIAIAYLSFVSRNLTDKQALKMIVTTFIIFHGATALLEFYGLTQGISLKIIGNIILRSMIVVLFYYYGILKKRTT
ncbi:MAG: hypothetical protein V4580_14150 [Bacteroidota bacterium]